MTSSPEHAHRASGAYGFRVIGDLGSHRRMTLARDDWPFLEVRLRNEPRSTSHDGLVLSMGEAGSAVLEENRRRVVFHTAGLQPEEVVHPYLAPVAAVFALWQRWHPLHGGAVEIGGKAWGLLGDRHVGKSSLLGRLATLDHPVVADDLLVANGSVVHAGPRCVDLRVEVAEHLGVGTRVRAGLRERWRMDLGRVEPELPLGGWFFPTWGDRVEAIRISPSGCLERLIRHHYGLPVPSLQPAGLLELAALPAWELRRPESLSSLDASVECLLEMIS